MTARIYQKSKTAMQSGVKNSGQWILEFEQNDWSKINLGRYTYESKKS